MVEESGDGKLKLEDCNVAMEMQKKTYRILITERNAIVAERMCV